MMNKIFISAAIGFMLVANAQLFAQREKEIKNSDVEGIYLTVDDFKNGLLTNPTDKIHEGDKIKLRQFFFSPDIVSIEQDKETLFYKDSIFAIHLISGKNYRFINRTPCLVTDTSYLYIYTYKTTKTEYKSSGPRRRRKEIPITYYYFSVNNHKAVYTLSLTNLRKYALTDTAIQTAVFNKFTTDDMLKEINSHNGRFALNETILLIANK
jgi:hypothetical protein